MSINSRDDIENSKDGKNLKYVLKASFQAHDYYTIGSYDPDMENVTNRRILWGWINESYSSTNDIKKG
ncbi:glycoside hydrolase, family 32 [Artemisia annua]|uniref:Glycoside hydrolase, family 32 n=1 Tax=Artemisia annua TaxID=35608 RepID=A0A2U1LAF3_ARTAN|nr:glycoside hydrolase, family 32 [Artemisia annua]